MKSEGVPTAAWILLLSILVGTEGCSKAPDAVPVTGHITYRGQPLAQASAAFIPQSGRAVVAKVSRGEFSADLMPGEYTVTIRVEIEYPPDFEEGDPVPPLSVILPSQYAAQADSPLKVTVVDGQNEPIQWDLR
jgi:hypothetical protein